MKKRIKIDSSLLSLLIIITGFLFYFTDLYSKSRALDAVFNFIGFISIYKGVMLRMAARAHKKHFSQRSEELVTTGLYAAVRNPMYLGSFTIGLGFAFLLWPWWMVPFFALIFYWRFRREIVIEENKLGAKFGHNYKEYCSTVPRLFPKISKMWKVRIRSLFNLDEAMSTKEKRGLFVWPALAVLMEMIQQSVIFGHFELKSILTSLVLAAAVFAGVLILKYE
jgi:protein-S-isoprenylcysteine O-methyltransferase Ste14